MNSTGNYKEEIRQTEHQFYDHPVYRQAIVDWEPDFIEVSATGDLGYSYGKYLWQIKDSTGRISEYKGVYMTI
ncbi:MAG TPA: hypothetical protein PKH94_07150 [Bacteroidales bacterium]|nr:hypothetical protein [Bacteroidales bacterium]HNS46999.1 hypothetical protein [Bacteroidales bacterium]